MKYSGAVMLPEIHKKWGEGQVKKICNWFIHNASMQKKLIISYIILVSIPLCILGIHSFSAANQNLLDQTEVTMDNNLHRMCQEADAIFRERQILQNIWRTIWNFDRRWRGMPIMVVQSHRA